MKTELPHSLIAIGHLIADHFVAINKTIAMPKNAHKERIISSTSAPWQSALSTIRECADPLGLLLF